MKVVADDSVTNRPNLVAGANRDGFHTRNVNYQRDWQADVVTDIALAREGDTCPFCGGHYSRSAGRDGAHLQLGTRYTERMGANFLDADGVSKPAIMGCYGIGVSRMLQCVIEVHHDERGIIWPRKRHALRRPRRRPGPRPPDVASKAELLYNELRNAGLEVLYDDSRRRLAGVKFNDADLLGLPVRLTVSPAASKRAWSK